MLFLPTLFEVQCQPIVGEGKKGFSYRLASSGQIQLRHSTPKG
jgi:hypothetical protein